MPQMGYDTKIDRLTDCQSQCDFDFDLRIHSKMQLGSCNGAGELKYIHVK
jgi:hypothetical protein